MNVKHNTCLTKRALIDSADYALRQHKDQAASRHPVLISDCLCHPLQPKTSDFIRSTMHVIILIHCPLML